LKRDLTAIAHGTEPSTFLNPKELDTLTRRHLRETFRATSSIQDDIATGWTARLNL